MTKHEKWSEAINHMRGWMKDLEKLGAQNDAVLAAIKTAEASQKAGHIAPDSIENINGFVTFEFNEGVRTLILEFSPAMSCTVVEMIAGKVVNRETITPNQGAPK